MGEKEPLAQWHAKLGESFFCLGSAASSERLISRPCYSLSNFISPPPQIWMTWSVISPGECASLYLLLAKLLYELAVLLAMYDITLAFSQQHVKL